SLSPRPPRSPPFPYTTLFRSLSMVASSSADRPEKRWRTSSQAVRSPMLAVRGAAMEASSRVVQREFQAAPDQMRPAGPRSMEKRSEEHTSELQSLRHLVCRLL